MMKTNAIDSCKMGAEGSVIKFRLTRKSLLQAVIAVLSLAGVAVFATAALAANVDYEDKPLGAVTPNTPLMFDHPLYVQALAESDVADGVGCAPNCPDNGTQYQLSYGSGFTGLLTITGEPIPVSCPDCSPFDLFKIDVAEPIPGSGPISLAFLGTTASGESVQFDFVSDGIIDGPGGQPDFETVVLPDTFRDLGSVGILVAAPYLGVAIDNIIVEPEIQPAPALAPLSLGMLALVLCVTAIWFGRNRATAR
jgi:hypothetical protein